MSVFDQVVEIIKANLSLGDKVITLDSNLEDDLGADSIDAMQIVMELEDTFEIEIPTEAAENIKTVKDLVDYIENSTK